MLKHKIISYNFNKKMIAQYKHNFQIFYKIHDIKT